MKLKLLLSIICLQIVQLLCSQNVYPKKVVINSDTLCLITIAQVKHIDKTFLELDKQAEMNDSLASMIRMYKSAFTTSDLLEKSLRSQILLKDQSMIELDKIIDNDGRIQKNDARHIAWLKLQRNTFVVAIAVAAVKIFLIH